MLIAYLILIPFLILSLWLFFKFTPKAINSKKVKVYNFCTLVLAVIASITYSLILRSSMINGSDYGWWPVLAFIFSLAISIAIIFLSAIIRNLIIFRSRR
jgi:hypothetical protein